MNPTLFLKARRRLSLAVASLSLLSAPTLASDYPEAVQRLLQQGVEITDSFEAPGNMTGYVGHLRDQAVGFYLTADGKHVVLGPMLDADGTNLTEASIEELLRAPRHDEAWNRLEAGHWIADGDANAETILYTFTDPNCPFCHRFREAADPWIAAGKVQLRHVMVGIIRPDSATKAALIVGAENPETKLRLLQQNQEAGNISASGGTTEAAREQIMANNRLMREMGLQATPSTFYRDDNGNIALVQGIPQPDQFETMMGSVKP